MLFKELSGISPDTLKVLDDLGFVNATPVQEACIPHFLGHKDVAVDACTGSGKTLAFVIPVLEKLRKLDDQLRKNQVGAMIITPTRELARQVFQVAAPFWKTVSWIQPLLLTGGSDVALDVTAFQENGGNVIIGTPGRVADVMKRSSTLDTKQLEVLVLDEADRLLDMGFRTQLDFIMTRLPKQRRTGLFSATQTEAVQELARAGLRNAIRVNVAVRALQDEAGPSDGAASQKTPLGLRICYQVCESSDKLAKLIQFLKEHKQQKVIAFMLTCACVDLWASLIKRLPEAAGLQVAALHGRMKQSQRQSTLAHFASQPAGCLLCTDVAARGLDIPDVEWILQLDPPQSPDSVVHRVGRTARMGRQGNALMYLLPHETGYVDFLRVRKVPVDEAERGEQVSDLMPSLRAAALKDREVLEKGIRAFVSYVRGYKEHHCKYIFRLQDLDLGKLAYACALLQLPRMPEIRRLGGKAQGFTPADVNPNTVKFLDKKRQKVREHKLEEQAREAAAKLQQPAVKPSKQHEAAGTTAKRVPAAKRRLLEDRQDVSDFASDYALLKKLKRGKLSEEDFELATEEEPETLSTSAEAQRKGKSRGKGKAFKHFKQGQRRKETKTRRKTKP